MESYSVKVEASNSKSIIVQAEFIQKENAVYDVLVIKLDPLFTILHCPSDRRT